LGIALVVAAVILTIPLAIVAGILAAVHAKPAALLVMLVGVAAMVALFVWVLLRLSLMGPMMVEDGRFHLADTWSLTRGRAVDLFVIGICLFVILLVIELIVGAFAIGIGLAILSQAAGGLSNIQGFFTRPPAEILSTLAPALIAFGIIGIPLTGCLMAIVAAPWAKAYRDLVQSDAAATFA
jgi:hypothetical protein